MSEVFGMVVFFVSTDGEKEWKPVNREDVPLWVRDPDTLGYMLEGHMAHDEQREGWYVAVLMPDKAEPVSAPKVAVATGWVKSASA